ncbi:MAG: hypothetical protein KC652_25200 [Cyanobacteria bacterium HKST-UBA01]|nr:hypothetical protein [Cyanobacteria bacterium HKST-UBA01]
MTKEDMTTTPQKDDKEKSEEKYLLGQILVDLGYITIYQLDEALQLQRSDAEANGEQKPLGQWLLELGYCGPNQLIRAIQVQSELRKMKESGKAPEAIESDDEDL